MKLNLNVTGESIDDIFGTKEKTKIWSEEISKKAQKIIDSYYSKLEKGEDFGLTYDEFSKKMAQELPNAITTAANNIECENENEIAMLGSLVANTIDFAMNVIGEIGARYYNPSPLAILKRKIEEQLKKLEKEVDEIQVPEGVVIPTVGEA